LSFRLRLPDPNILRDPPGSPKFLMLLSRTYSCATSHALRGPRQTLRALTRYSALFVLASGPLTPSPSASGTCVPYALYRGCIKLQRVRSLRNRRLHAGLRGSLCTLQLCRSVVRFITSLHNFPSSCNTRYGWVVSPYPEGTLTPQEAPSLLGALTVVREPQRRLAIRAFHLLTTPEPLPTTNPKRR